MHPGDTQETPRRHPGDTQMHPGDTQETPRRHPGDTHLRFSPLNLNKHNYKLCTNHLQNASKEYEILETKQQRILFKASILTCFWALEPVWGRLGDHPGMGTLKVTKKTLSVTSFLEHIYNRYCTCVVTISFMFSGPPFSYPSGPKGTHKPPI